MAQPFYLDIMDANGKKIASDGSMGGLNPPDDGCKDSIVALMFMHKVYVPTVAGGAGGVVSNAPMTDGITITKFVDKTSPILQQSLSQILQSANFKFYAPDKTGNMSPLFNVQIGGVSIVNIQMNSDHSGASDANQSIPEEDITFTFKTITYNWADGGVQYQRNAPGK